MNKENKEAMNWLINRLKSKYKIPKKTTKSVLNAISDLEWDYSRSRYDLCGLQIEDLLSDLGKDRCPDNKRFK